MVRYDITDVAHPPDRKRDQFRRLVQRMNLAKFEKLLNEGLITKQQVTTQEALVDQYRGALQANAAQVNNAKVQLGYTRILAPIAGRLGLRQVDAGNMIHANDTNGLVVITQVQPIDVVFPIPETNLPRVQRRLREEIRG